jgi:hypothetical protein
MDASVIRLQLPAGAAFLAAFDDAAFKYAGRRGFADGGVLFTTITSAAVRAVASASPATIELVAREHTAKIVTVVRGQQPASAMTASATDAFTTAASGLAPAPTVNAASAVIEFSLPLT